MMMMILKKHLSFSHFFSPIPTKNPTFSLLHSSFSSTPIQNNLPPKNHFMTEYLITTCSFPSDKATKISKSMPKLTSTEKPNSVLHFLKHHNFTDANIRTIVSSYPPILCIDVNNTLEPNLRKISELGFNGPELQQLITSSPTALVRDSSLPRLQFWLSLLKDNKRSLLSAFKRNQGLMDHDIDKGVLPKIDLLKEHGLSDSNIGTIAKLGQQLITRSTDSMRLLLMRVKELGFSPESGMFVHILLSLSGLSSDNFRAKMEFFKSFGWSEEEFLTAFKKGPFITHLTEENIGEKMEFLVGKAGCSQSYIASHPLILGYSLEKRMKPRLHVMEILCSNESVKIGLDLYSIMAFTEKNFVKKIILRHMDKVPTLLETYNAACAGKIPL